ncbi:MAG: hypothetical protein NC132_04400 [Corallococcus sp.]|nr:hypothetical protein [Corallococcus sp.]MCM1359901.1 hypothetical protein [Corallococcus sp.]MCM1395335.1 hypothetical protein [Corallococcus sp.]
MKKIIALILALTMVAALSVFAACDETDTPTLDDGYFDKLFDRKDFTFARIIKLPNFVSK